MGGGNRCIFATSVGSDLPLLGISGRSLNFCHNLGNNFLIGQWLPEHPELYYQSPVGVASSSFTSESKMTFRGKSDFSEPSRISASAELQSLLQSGLRALLNPSYQDSKIGSVIVRRSGSVTTRRLLGGWSADGFGGKSAKFDSSGTFDSTQMLWHGRCGVIISSESAKKSA